MKPNRNPQQQPAAGPLEPSPPPAPLASEMAGTMEVLSATEVASDPADLPNKAFVVSKVGTLVHLFTGVAFDGDPKRVEIDGFVRAQIDAGKLEIVDPESM